MARLYYSEPGIEIYHGDCREVLPSLSADVVITDPPYGINLGSNVGANDKRSRGLRRSSYDVYDDTADNYLSVVAPAISMALSCTSRGAVFGCAPSIWHLPPPSALGGVYIDAAVGFSPWGFQNLALILFYGTAPNRHIGAHNTMFRARGISDRSIGHPCPKPLPWLVWLVNLASKEGETVIDPFMGSGTTLRAAKDLGRKAIGIEISEKYCEIAVRRLSQGVLAL